MTNKHENKGKKSNKENSIKHPYKTIENPETGKITEGENGSLDRKSAAQNPARQKREESNK